MINHQEKLNWIRIARTKNIGPITFFQLLKKFHNIQNIIDNVEDYFTQNNSKKKIKLYSQDLANKELEDSYKIGAKIISFNDHQYPTLLKNISDPPLTLTILGNTSLLNTKSIAIVGSRNASLNGCKFANKIAQDLSNSKITTISGMARGIDTAAHYGSLNSRTIAVIAGGINNIYPKENTKLYHQIRESGLIISENKIDSSPCAANFPRRNRIISGLSLGTLVIEATIKSGTLITARCALEQNREVFSVPGFPLDPRHQGTNMLIKQGAKLVENVDDILEEINRDDENIISEENLKQPEEQGSTQIDDNQILQLILQKISSEPIAEDELISQTNLPTAIVKTSLVQMELEGVIEVRNGKIAALY